MMYKYIILSLLFISSLYANPRKTYEVLCTAIIKGERTCFILLDEKTRVTFTVPCECDAPCIQEEAEEEHIEEYEYPPEDLIPIQNARLSHK